MTIGFCATALSALMSVATASAALADTPVERGRYLVGIMDCAGCHTTGALTGKPDPARYLGGADIGWLFPSGVVAYPRNITPDKSTGIGSWSTDDIVKLLRTGLRPDGREVMPIMNWRSYRTLTDPDIQAVAAYLKSVPPVDHPVPGLTPLAEVKTPYFTVAKP